MALFLAKELKCGLSFTLRGGSGKIYPSRSAMKKKFALFIILSLIVFQLIARNDDPWELSLNKISSLLSIIEENYYDKIDYEELPYSTIRGLLQTLDPHSYFLDPENFSRMREEQTGKYYGLGIQIQKQGDLLVVVSPIEGGPAWRLGIQAGDIISHINGESTKPISSVEAMNRLRGPKGTKVTITIVREGLENPLELTIEREEISFKSVPYAFMLNSDTGYIFIRHFSETTTAEFEEKMAMLLEKGMQNLVLDLRGNYGGPLFQSIDLSDEFLPPGARIVSMRGRNRIYNKEFNAFRDKQYEKIPLVILINQGSASASEIVSGAIMDNDRGLIIGEESWGKGLVQTVYTLPNRTAVAITTAKYYTPSGRSIQRDYSHLEDYLLNNKSIPAEAREVRYTLKGRKVLGQGGITPDYEVKLSFKPLTSELVLRAAFFNYTRKFTHHLTPFSKKLIFPGEEKKVDENLQEKKVMTLDFLRSPELLEDFKGFLRGTRINFEEDKFFEAEAEIRRELEREIVTAIWGVEEGIKVYRKQDPVVLKALEVMPEAVKMIW